MDDFAIPVNEKEGGVTRYGIGFHELFPGGAFRVYLEINESGIIVFSQFFLGEYGFRHVFARAAPFGVDIYENGFVFGLGFRQDFFPRARFEFHALGVACHASHEYTYK